MTGAVAVELAGRSVLVVGSSAAALAAATLLRDAGARVQVLSDDPTPGLLDLADRGQLELLAEPPELAGFALVAARTDEPAADDRIERNARAAGRPVLPRPAVSHRDEVQAGDGRVVIVGGGPGDPGLLTVAGERALAAADVVIADRLAPLAVLDGLPRRPEVIDAAKLPHGPGMSQQRINELLIEHARAGRRVVRLKGGDPFVFGRGMEEVLACAAAGLSTEVIPGVTSAVAVPELAGIPVTHRGFTQAFTVVSGHLPPGHADSTIDWAALARSGATLVLLMAVRTLPAIADALVAGGLPPQTPVATVMNGSRPDARTIRSTLGTVPEIAAEVRAPAVTIVGSVAGELG